MSIYTRLCDALAALGPAVLPDIRHHFARAVPVAPRVDGGLDWAGDARAQLIINPAEMAGGEGTLCADEYEIAFDFFFIAVAEHPSDTDPAPRSSDRIAFEDYYKPYYQALAQAIDDDATDLGRAIARMVGRPRLLWLFVSGDRAGCVLRARVVFEAMSDLNSLE